MPGTVRGWEEALRRNGTMSMTGALGPAIRVARDGFVVDQTFVDQTQQNLDYFDDVPSTQALYLDPDGTPRDVGTVLRNPDLARTYERIARLGAKGFCRGAVADAMVEAVQHPPVAADADFFDVPLTGLLSDGFAAERRALIDPQHAATSPVPPGGPYPYNAGGAGRDDHAPDGLRPRRQRRGLHVHDRVDRRQLRRGTRMGFLLNNELTDFNFDSLTHPNRVEGSKRPRSSMSPTIVLEDGQPLLALGSPGGSTMITVVLQILLDRLDLAATLPQAIAAPRASQRKMTATLAEPAFVGSPEGQVLAAQYGHRFSTTSEIGAATGIELLADGRVLAAAMSAACE